MPWGMACGDSVKMTGKRRSSSHAPRGLTEGRREKTQMAGSRGEAHTGMADAEQSTRVRGQGVRGLSGKRGEARPWGPQQPAASRGP